MCTSNSQRKKILKTTILFHFIKKNFKVTGCPGSQKNSKDLDYLGLTKKKLEYHKIISFSEKIFCKPFDSLGRTKKF